VRRLLLAVGLLLVTAPVAHAGGWSTVGLSSTPNGVGAGKAWVVDITVLQHGRTPLADVQPVVTIKSADRREEFAAKPTGKTGVYRASVVFPAAGRWTYEIDDGFMRGMPHTYPAVRIGGAPASVPAAATTPGDDGGPRLLWLVPGIVLLLAAAALALRSRTRTRASAHHHPQAA
jgi:hypothetical protein